MPRYRFVPSGRGGVAWTENVSKGRVLHYAKWHGATFERVGGRFAGAGRRRHRSHRGYQVPRIPPIGAPGGVGSGLGGLELAALLMSLNRRLPRRNQPRAAR